MDLDLHPILRRLQQLQSARAAAQAGDEAAADATVSSFAAQGRMPAGGLRMQVRGLGEVASPLSAEEAQQLHAASRPAPYGQGERTLLDTAVRHTGEIDAEAVTLAWPEAARAALLREVATALGSAPLQARLHALLVYGPGQFFKPHQDTEKHDGMVGTLVLVWPSAHLGGQLVVRHQQGQFGFASQQLGAGDVRWCAFYADCRHEVLPVEEGWRIALTFDLVVADAAKAEGGDAAPDAALQQLLRDEFALASAPSLRPWVLLLEHEYTEHGLRWHLLKGPDRERVAALRAAAEPLGLSLHLALAELHQTWSATFENSSSRYGRSSDKPMPDELIDSSLTLDHWVDTLGHASPRQALGVDEEQLHSFSDTDEAYLVDEDYEGYMGNWGETLDYWYRRAALVIQSPAAAERSRFQRDPKAVLRELQALARQARKKAPTGKTHTATQPMKGAKALSANQAEQVEQTQQTHQEDPAAELAARFTRLRDLLIRDARTQEPDWLALCADIAAALPDAEDARALMAGFDATAFAPADMKALVRLQRGRGAAWLQGLWAGWAQRDALRPAWSLLQVFLPDGAGGPGSDGSPSARRRGLWPEPLRDVVVAGMDAGLAPALMQQIAGDWALDALRRVDAQRAAWTPAQRQDGLQRVMGDAIALAQAMGALPEPDACLQRLVEHVTSQPSLYPPAELEPVIQVLGQAAARWPVDRPLRERVVAALREALARPPSDPDDHTLRGVEWTCTCADCLPVTRWAESPTAQPLVLPMAEPRRRHVQEQLARAAAPVTGETIRVGSPHKLRLEKARDLHARQRGRRDAWQAALTALEACGE